MPAEPDADAIKARRRAPLRRARERAPLLALDSCLGTVSVAVAVGQALYADVAPRLGGLRVPLARVVGEATPQAPGEADCLAPMIASVLRQARVSARDLGRIAVTLGPGSFTGVRAGIAAARALALALETPIVAMSSLAVMAEDAVRQLASTLQNRVLAVAVHGGAGVVYLGLFKAGVPARGSERRAAPLRPPLALTPARPGAELKAHDVLAVGGAGDIVAAAIRAAGGTAEAALPRLEPHARWLALCAPELTPVARLVPLYLRAPDAKLPLGADGGADGSADGGLDGPPT
jgi:tRNA threonylcarbamoyladenosine biosynthesis protein TsaB